MSVDRYGPVLIEGPVEAVAPDGTVVTSDRFLVAVCTCRRSRTYPWCDTSHRARRKPPGVEGQAHDDPRAGHDRKDSHDSDDH